MRTCCRCGTIFKSERGILCPICRVPKLKAEVGLSGKPLSLREYQVSRLVARAKLNKEIAFELHLTEGTIKEYLNRIYQKLGLHSRMELALWQLRADGALGALD